MKMIATLIILFFIIGCTDKNVNKIDTKLFEVDGIYLKKITIEGDHIYFVIDHSGNPIAGTSSSFRKGKQRVKSATIITEENP
jgi:hypothetical protein